MSEEITTEQVQGLMDFLEKGKLPTGLQAKNPPNLGPEMAFSVIYYLQEEMHIIPDKFEKCHVCHSIFDSEAGGYFISYGEYDEDFYPEVGITEADYEANDGKRFCGHGCEMAFWDEFKPDRLVVV